ncbi:MAG: hypothetical protein DRQ47_07705 [Gammaproteobacteria bacterium]|nr:MAG: hypothetical protein DRQ47_07705 [Gammaproteobacteria bacterium]
MCLKNYILSKGCDGVSPSDLYIESLPGIETELLNALADEHQKDWKNYYSDVQDRAIMTFNTDLRSALLKEFKIKSVLSNTRQRLKYEPGNITAAQKYRGQRLILDDFCDDEYTTSTLRVFHVNRIKVFLETAQTVTVKVYDLELQKELDSFEITDQGWNIIEVYKDYTAYDLFIGMDSTLVDPVQTKLEDCYCYHSDMKIEGYETESLSDLTGVQTNSTHGVLVDLAVQCSFEPVICQNRNLLGRALLYAIGVEITKDLLASKKASRFTTFNRERSEQLIIDFYAQYRGGPDSRGADFEGELPLIVSSIVVNESDVCLECNHNTKVVVWP